MAWAPTHISFAGDAFTTATETVFVVTDAGNGYLKAMGNRGGPHLLAADWVATQLASWFGLPTFEIALLEVTDIDEIYLAPGKLAQVGPAFISKEMSGTTWGGGKESLEALVNPEDIGRLVVFDTWTRNCDRNPPDPAMRKPNRNNVFFGMDDVPDGRSRLIAMDHTHCFNCGRDLNAGLSHIDLVQDERIYGLFPEFVPFMSQPALRPAWEEAVDRLGNLDEMDVTAIVNAVPTAWAVDVRGREALVRQITQRAGFIQRNFRDLIAPHL